MSKRPRSPLASDSPRHGCEISVGDFVSYQQNNWKSVLVEVVTVHDDCKPRQYTIKVNYKKRHVDSSKISVHTGVDDGEGEVGESSDRNGEADVDDEGEGTTRAEEERSHDVVDDESDNDWYDEDATIA
eukprot:3018819-Rhodomonas_salina.1